MSQYNFPDAKGHFGPYGGVFVAETLFGALDGSKILFAILPGEFVYRLRPLEQFGFIILMAVVFFAPQVLQAVIVAPALATLRLLTG